MLEAQGRIGGEFYWMRCSISPFQVTSLPRDVTSAGHDWVQPGPEISPTSMGKQSPLVVREFL